MGQDSQPSSAVKQLLVDPPTVKLSGPNPQFSIIVSGKTSTGQIVDLTHSAQYQVQHSELVAVSSNGVLQGLLDGQSSVTVTYNNLTVNVPVVIQNSQTARTFNFENDIIPVFSKFGCNAAGCHGKAEGQNGFKLSVFGFDPKADLSTLTSEGRGRRVFPAVPEESLLLTKASGGVPHGGGIRIHKGTDDYRTLRDWIAAGMPFGKESDPKVVSIRVTPQSRQLRMNDKQQLRVVATYSDGRQLDVTRHAKFQSNNDALAGVNEFGLVNSLDQPGEVAIMAAYMGAVDIFRALVPRPQPSGKQPEVPKYNFIDGLVDAKLNKLNIAPSQICTDADFLRRVSLDCIGTLPTAEESRKFLTDASPNKRAQLVKQLLQRPEYADYWSMKWADLLRVDRQALGHKGAYSYYRWIRESFAQNKPYDQFVREAVSAEGLLRDAPAGHLYKVVKDPGSVASTVSQVFLGIRIECAQCHHHPFDRWSQTDYLGIRAYFTQVGFKTTNRGEMIAALKTTATKHPRTGAAVFAHPLATENPETSPAGDRRQLLAAWMTADENPWFAKNLVNRVWAHFAGRGLVEPVDDVRSTNPPTNPELLNALADHFIESNYDIHQLIETIASSRTYQLSSQPNETNAKDSSNYSRALFKRIDAEVLFDAICQTTGVSEKFEGMPAGYRAIQLWDSHVPHYFLKLFGRPVRSSVCECERSSQPSVSQVLHVLNSPNLQSKLSHESGRLARLTEQFKDDSRLIEELYLTFFNRFPTTVEQTIAANYLKAQENRQLATEDLTWAMMNSMEFMFNH
jgi:hypothetical protein